MPDLFKEVLKFRIIRIEHTFAQSSMATVYARYHARLERFNQASFWKRMMMGGFLRRKYLTYMLDWALDEYLWESTKW
ncbi:hypothetical protein GCM10028803_53070 [Larkinella knui]|uniref:Uncharacterized protein n=1 Tax=Larkinella knui TaxID=2025310 RepID=A0A3P1CGU8_9BACT|nr:hypothetical protein [Larkinella knui]RRB12487.1 hypothetical protein EHT87_20015 [Larkinella knui]